MMKKYLLFAVCTLMMACGGKSSSQAGDSAEDEQAEGVQTEVKEQEAPSVGMAVPEGKEVENAQMLEHVWKLYKSLSNVQDKRTCAYQIRKIVGYRRKELEQRLKKDDSPAVRAYVEAETKKLDEYMEDAKTYIHP